MRWLLASVAALSVGLIGANMAQADHGPSGGRANGHAGLGIRLSIPRPSYPPPCHMDFWWDCYKPQHRDCFDPWHCPPRYLY